MEEGRLLRGDVSFIMFVWSSASGLEVGVSVWQDVFEWMLEGVSIEQEGDQSLGLVLATWLWWLRDGDPGSGVDVFSRDSVDLTLLEAKTKGENFAKSSKSASKPSVSSYLPGWESGRALWLCGTPAIYCFILRTPRFNMHGTQRKGEVLFPAILRRSARCCLSPAGDKRPAKGRQESTPKAHHHLLRKTQTNWSFSLNINRMGLRFQHRFEDCVGPH